MVGGSTNGVESEIARRRLDRGTTFELLTNDRRRYATYYLLTREEGGPFTIGEMADQIAAWEYGTTVSEVSPRERKLVYNSLQQSHLPKLAEFGIVEYDADRGTVEITEQGHLLEGFLYAGESDGWVWRYVYLGIGTLGLVVGFGLALDISPVTGLSPVGWLLLFSATLCVCSVLHVYHARLRPRLGNKPPSVSENRTVTPQKPNRSPGREESSND